VVVDEAHLLGADQLEELRLLTNAEMDSHSPFACLLVGQPTLRRRIKLGTFAALEQRIALRFAMPAMTAAETGTYVAHHLKLAGRADTLFSDDALGLVHQVSRGLPRAVNNLALQSLVAAYAARKAIVDESSAQGRGRRGDRGVSDDRHLAENDRVHHLTITAVISEGPGIEIVAAELLRTWPSASATRASSPATSASTSRPSCCRRRLLDIACVQPRSTRPRSIFTFGVVGVFSLRGGQQQAPAPDTTARPKTVTRCRRRLMPVGRSSSSHGSRPSKLPVPAQVSSRI
jgi:hypothetical protein